MSVGIIKPYKSIVFDDPRGNTINVRAARIWTVVGLSKVTLFFRNILCFMPSIDTDRMVSLTLYNAVVALRRARIHCCRMKQQSQTLEYSEAVNFGYLFANESLHAWCEASAKKATRVIKEGVFEGKE